MDLFPDSGAVFDSGGGGFTGGKTAGKSGRAEVVGAIPAAFREGGGADAGFGKRAAFVDGTNQSSPCHYRRGPRRDRQRVSGKRRQGYGKGY